jgi:hypothetical protein
MIAFTPKVELKGQVVFRIGFHLGVQEFYFSFEFNFLKFNPLKFLVLFDPYNLRRHCYSLGFTVSAVEFSTYLQTRTNECDSGIIGLLTKTEPLCFWRTYEPPAPLIHKEFIPQAEFDQLYLRF